MSIQKEIQDGIWKLVCSWEALPPHAKVRTHLVKNILKYLDEKDVVVKTNTKFISTVAQFRTERLVEE